MGCGYAFCERILSAGALKFSTVYIAMSRISPPGRLRLENVSEAHDRRAIMAANSAAALRTTLSMVFLYMIVDRRCAGRSSQRHTALLMCRRFSSFLDSMSSLRDVLRLLHDAVYTPVSLTRPRCIQIGAVP
ncbi:hypothetical protein BU23DRAFT_658354 [Bimuria novae-zelandiae CBS 107.79]|uniref:Uncharacterized protein n=1 Tax=Bimuria novae-zelandiae CBS 107.79 TaxID=1447943 RepID=A0A6A5US54_9PLEO|nr:hypothetical protein BU23DRAFT_658354 [Bimuria novae-zelandiae CBS 107.79]